MENASKALLIAGSILIVIVLIAVGVRVFNSTSGTKDSIEETMISTDVVTFNNKFMPYIGLNRTKTEAISLINAVIANNATHNYKIEVRIIKITVNGQIIRPPVGKDIEDLNDLLQKVSKSEDRIFRITSQQYNEQGYLSRINIEGRQ